MPPTKTSQDKSNSSASSLPNNLDLSTASLHLKGSRYQGADRSAVGKTEGLDQVGPHIEFLKALGGVAQSYVPAPAGGPRCPYQKRLKAIEEQIQNRIAQRGSGTEPPKDADVIAVADVLCAQKHTQPIRGFKEFLDRAGVVAGKTSYLQFPDNTYSAVRRRVLDNTAAANEVVWVETYTAIEYLFNLEFNYSGAQLFPSNPFSYQIRGFFNSEGRIAVVPMIDKRDGRPLSEWRAESLLVLQTAVHELAHGRGADEYQARAAGDAYLYRTDLMPTTGDPQRRLESLCLGLYSSEEYLAAVGHTMRDLKVSTIIAPARQLDPFLEAEALPMSAAVSIGAFSSSKARRRGDGAEAFTYGLTTPAHGHPRTRTVCVRHEGPAGHDYRWVGSSLTDRILREACHAVNSPFRGVVAEAISDHVARESMRIATLCNLKEATSTIIRDIADGVAVNIGPGDVHLAVREYVARRGGAAVLPHGKGTVWINSLPQGIAVRNAESVTIFFASPIHRGAALRIPMGEGDSYDHIAERVRAFERNSEHIEGLFARRRGKGLWESIGIPLIGRGARYLFPATEEEKQL